VCDRALIGCALLVVAAIATAEELPVRDPMRPFAVAAVAGGGATPAAPGPRFVLTAVVLAPERRVAVVNGEPRLLGDTVGGAKIVAIEADAVRLQEGDKELVIALGRRVQARSATGQGETVP
jgi:MSHA biogenesis protein MshK